MSAEEFSPYNLVSIRIPLGVVKHRGLSSGAKLLYGRLALYLGKPRPGARCNPNLNTLASEMGTSVDSVGRFLTELIEQKFIKRRRHRRQAAECVFLPHPCLLDSAQLRNQETPQDSAESRNQESQDSANLRLRFRKSAVKIPQNRPVFGFPTSYKNLQENIQENSSLESRIPENGSRPTDDDDLLRIQNEHPKNRIEAAREELRAARAEDLGCHPEEIQLPDEEITAKILGIFTEPEDFGVWLRSTVDRGLGRKAKDRVGWGLYRTDAERRVGVIALERQSEAKLAAELEREDAVAAVGRAKEECRLRTPMPLDEAFALIRDRVRRVPEVLQTRLRRTGELISPIDLESAIGSWRRCPTCRDEGTVGNVIDRSLAFCDCPAGTEAQFRDGADWPEREVARVHADPKELLILGLRDVGYPVHADAVAESDVSDDGASLAIRFTVGLGPCLARDLATRPAIHQALERVGRTRRVELSTPTTGRGLRVVARSEVA